MCIFSALLSGSAGSHGRRRATRTGRIHSELPLLVPVCEGGVNVPVRRCDVVKLEPPRKIMTALVKSVCEHLKKHHSRPELGLYTLTEETTSALPLFSLHLQSVFVSVCLCQLALTYPLTATETRCGCTVGVWSDDDK